MTTVTRDRNRGREHGVASSYWLVMSSATKTGRRFGTVLLAIILGIAANGCKDLSGTQSLAAGVVDPRSFNNADGVAGLVDGTRGLFRVASDTFLLASGLFSDELTWADHEGALTSGLYPDDLAWADSHGGNTIDARQVPEGIEDPTWAYQRLQGLRVAAATTIEAARLYVPSFAPASVGEMFAMQGYAEIMLADFFCSGLPLSFPRHDADIDYRSGSSTTEIYQHAVTLFDSALAVSVDSTHIMTLARVGKGRAYLALGQYDSAARAVAAVDEGDHYALHAWVGAQFAGPGKNRRDMPDRTYDFWLYSVADREGGVGLPYRSSNDPRTGAQLVDLVVACNFEFNYCIRDTTYYPTKFPYVAVDSANLVIADWVEAGLIRAEAALQHNDLTGWLQELNHLRAVAITPALAPLADPGTSDARVDLLFAERAAWLFLTGHRQGDLRRLIRQYHRSPLQVYPHGDYNTRLGRYEPSVTMPVPRAEHFNPQFQGCLNRDA